MATKRPEWLERAAFRDALSSVDADLLRDMYDSLSANGWSDELIYPLLYDFISDPEGFSRAAEDVNPYLSGNTAMRRIVESAAGKARATKAPSFFPYDEIRSKIDADDAFAFFSSQQSDAHKWTTRLNPEDEQSFRNWYSGYSASHGVDPDPDDPEHYYDLRGWWKESTPSERVITVNDPDAHLSDKYKRPGHPTFSDESIYHDPGDPRTTGGHWNEMGFFRPSEYQKEHMDDRSYIDDPNERLVRQRYTESAFKDDAYMPVSKARGAYQIAPGALTDYVNATGRRGDLNNYEYNKQVRDWYMDRLPSYIGDDYYSRDSSDVVNLAKTYAAYNWGAGNLRKHLKAKRDAGVDIDNSLDWIDGMPEETRNYVNFIVLGKDVDKRLNTEKFDSAVSKLG